MNRDSYPLPSAQEIAESLEMPLEEAEALLERMRSKSQGRRFRWPTLTLAEALAVVAFTGVLAGVLSPTPCGGNRESARRSSCLSNAKQLANALLMYTTDYDNRLPPANRWQDGIFPYVKNERLWDCPTRKEQAQSYSYNALLHCLRVDDIDSPDKRTLLFESGMAQRNASDLGATFVTPHDKRGVVAYVDGHVKAVPALVPEDIGLIRVNASTSKRRLPPVAHGDHR